MAKRPLPIDIRNCICVAYPQSSKEETHKKRIFNHPMHLLLHQIHIGNIIECPQYTIWTTTRVAYSAAVMSTAPRTSPYSYYTREATVTTQLLEACLNRTFRNKYNLQTRVTKFSCNEYNETVETNFGDFCTGLIVFTFAGLAIFSTFLDIFLPNIKLEDYPLFLNFSIRHNWRRLIAPYEVETESNRQIFKSLHGIRVVMVSLVILGHSRVPHVITMKNLKLIEESYKDIFLYIFLNGNIIVQTYFVTSGMLLVYKLQCYSERYKIDFHLIPKLIWTRWLRLVPPHAFVTLFAASWLRHTKSGPLWEKYRYVYWALLPACLVPMFLGSVFYGPTRHPVYLQLLYAVLSKPYFGLLVAIIIFGFVFKYENVYRGFFEWSNWRVLSRLSYCAFLVHFLIIRLYTASHTQLTHITAYTNVAMVTGFIISSFAIALPLWLLVEAPSTGLLQYYTTNNLSEKSKSEKFKNT
ncbi:hypothetical protein RR48_01133 [Papilio machaon]|uniref:Nose resistant to fluoxetine protein 6 n=1 Tax=Papilio machaon TaxID=76193 RepID=A0A0N1PG38_PAPMA|nr:hypothetical protein RR48_01133 [Papilio machaon]